MDVSERAPTSIARRYPEVLIEELGIQVFGCGDRSVYSGVRVRQIWSVDGLVPGPAGTDAGMLDTGVTLPLR
jgi:hypothetical protein